MDFKISIAQINPKSGDIRGNALLVLEAIEEARRQGADIVVLPEMCVTGYCLDEKLLINRQFLRANKKALHEQIIPACQEIAAVVGFVDFEEDRIGPDERPVRYNAAAIIESGRLLQVVHKRLLPSYRYFDDKRYFRPGREVEPVTLQTVGGEVRIGVLICEDLWDEGYDFKPCRVYAEKGVDYLFSINASPYVCPSPGRKDGKRQERDGLVRRHIDQFQVPIILVNTVGIGDNGKNIILFDGLSCAYNRRGELVAHLKSFEADQQLVAYRNGMKEAIAFPEFRREAEIYQGLVMGVRDYYDKIGIFNGVLEAISGGIDSSLGAAIAYEAMGPELLTVYNLPSRFNSGETREAARRLAENFGLTYKVIPIQDMVDRIQADFEKHLHPFRLPITLENLQARVRGLIMMAESNDQEALLLTNGNETEIALGYATLYGDMVGGLAVIGDLPKPDVYRLSRYVNERWGEERIPAEVFELPASAELKEDQVDPFDYDVVGPIVSSYIDLGLSPVDLIEAFEQKKLDAGQYGSNGGRDLYERYDRESFARMAHNLYETLNRSVYKRMQAAPIIVVSKRAFGFDLRETIINGWIARS